jgi:hypothetical protein
MELDAAAFPDAPALQAEGALGKLEPTLASGDTDGDGDFDQLVATGARSFSVWDAATGTLVWDSGDTMEQVIAERNPEHFNSTNDEQPSFEDRSDNAGPEPEGVVLGSVGDRTYAFIGLERIGGVMIYDVTNPQQPFYVDYVNGKDVRNFDEPVCTTVSSSGGCSDGEPNPKAGDLGPEGLVFVSAADSPNGAPLLIVGNEISGSTRIFEVVPKPTN